MKCLVLAGGKGDRLWPLSRKNYPKQFISLRNDHSIFQETIARNIPFCDEFIIVTNLEYQFIVENQMKAFQGITYRCVYEEIGRKTTAAIVLACLQFPTSELVFVVASDHLIEGSAAYKDAVRKAREWARKGYLVTFGMALEKPETRFGYIHYRGEDVLDFTEKPSEEEAKRYRKAGDYLINGGMFLFRVGELLQEIQKNYPWLANSCRSAYYMREVRGKHTFYPAGSLENIQAEPIEKTVFEKTRKGKVVRAPFLWKDIGSLEDLSGIGLQLSDEGVQVQHDCEDTTIINQCEQRAVVANGLRDVTIINTRDAVYVGQNGASGSLKRIMNENPQMQEYFDKGRVIYKPWGTYEILVSDSDSRYVVRRVILLEGRTIYAHQHTHRTDHWILVSGRARVLLGEREAEYGANANIVVPVHTTHQISNIGSGPLVFMEISTGVAVDEKDLVSVKSRDLTETELGYRPEPLVHLLPAFKDYLWGGTKLRDRYGKESDLEVIAESWELSAHKEGQSIVAGGRHKGMLFAEYLEKIGRENWGWKCQSMDRFPILVKLIDARENLSVQVHPGDDYALKNENEYGKNEMWYVIDCEEDAAIYCGFSRDVTKEEVRRRIEEDTILEILNRVPVRPGDAFYIPSGTVHAIGSGILLCEVQQSSNCTYRLYDYNRVDKYGNRRQLHLEKALEVLDTKKYEVPAFENESMQKEGCVCHVLSRCKYFESSCVQLNGTMRLDMGNDSFCSLLCVKGNGEIGWQGGEGGPEAFRAGDSMFLPVSDVHFQIRGNCDLIMTHI